MKYSMTMRLVAAGCLVLCAVVGVMAENVGRTGGAATTEGLVITGQTEPVAKVEVPAGMKGLLAEVDVKQGQVVKKGDVLAKMDDGVQQQVVALVQMQADTTTEIHAAQNQLEFAKAEYERWQKNASATDLEKRQKQLAVKQAELSVELYQEKQKQAAVKLKQEQIVLEHMTIRSPIDGFVLRVNKHAGEETDDNPLVVVVDVSKLTAVFYPPKQMFGKVKVGEKVMLDLAMEPVVKREAAVVAVDPIIDPASQLFQVKMEVENGDATVPAGTGATLGG